MNRLIWKLLLVLSLILSMAIGINSFILYRSMMSYSNIQLKRDLGQAADDIVAFIEEGSLKVLQVKNFEQTLDLLDYQVVITNPDTKKVLYTNAPGTRIRAVIERDQTVFVTRPIVNASGNTLANLAVFSRNSDLERITTIFQTTIKNTIIFGILLVALFMVLIYFLVNKPLNKIMDKMSQDAYIDVKDQSDWAMIARVHNEARDKRIKQEQEEKEFFQNASHELKSPLMNIQGVMEGMEDGIYSPEEASGLVVSETQRVKTLVDQMIRTSKAAGTGAEDIVCETIDMEAFMATMGKMVPQNLDFVYEGNEPAFYFDPAILEIIISNLVQNACRYAKHRIYVTYQSKNQESRLMVRDDGMGLESAVADKVFRRFVKGTDGKTGLGLAIVADYVTATGGQIEAYNAKGAVFQMTWKK